MANIKRAALDLIQDLMSSKDSYDPRSYGDLLTEGQDAIGRKIGYGEEVYNDYHDRKSRMRRMLGVPEDELAYQTMSVERDPKYLLARAIEDYTGSSSYLLNTPFRPRKMEERFGLRDYQDPHVRKQVQANELSSYLGPHNLKKVEALGKSFYPAPADFITWRGIPTYSTTMKKHWQTELPPIKTAAQELAEQRAVMDSMHEDNFNKYGEYDNWPEDIKKTWMGEAQKQNDLTAAYQSQSYGGTPYSTAPLIDKFPLYEDYGNEAFLSTSLDRPSARGFAEDDRGMFRILVPEGTPIRPVFPYSAHESEMEVLLPPRSVYKRTGERTRSGDVPLMWMGRGRPDSDKYIGAALPFGVGAGAGALEYEDAEQ